MLQIMSNVNAGCHTVKEFKNLGVFVESLQIVDSMACAITHAIHDGLHVHTGILLSDRDTFQLIDNKVNKSLLKP